MRKWQIATHKRLKKLYTSYKANCDKARWLAAILTLTIFMASQSFAEKIIFSANHLSGTIGDKTDSTTLSGQAYVKTESMEISADEITMSGDDFRFIEANGAIKGTNTESELDFTCVHLYYDRETKIATLSGDVNLTDTKNDVNAKAQLIEYNQNTDIAIMQVDINLTQKDNVCSGVYAVYRKKEQTLDLSGNAQIKQGQDTFRAQEITLDLDSQEITLDGRVKGSVVDERKSEEKKEEPPPATDSTATSDKSSPTDKNNNSEKAASDAANPATPTDSDKSQSAPADSSETSPTTSDTTSENSSITGENSDNANSADDASKEKNDSPVDSSKNSESKTATSKKGKSTTKSEKK